MSDFVSRLAARAVADTPRARPAAPPAAVERTVAPATPAAPAVRLEAPEVRAEGEQRGQRVPTEHVASPSIGARVVDRTVVRDTTALSHEVDAVLAAEPAPEPVRVVHAVPVTASTVPTAVLERSVARAQPVATAPAGEPPVRVHIGRLEVRANLAQPPASRPPVQRPAASAELSLADYLRGRRTA